MAEFGTASAVPVIIDFKSPVVNTKAVKASINAKIFLPVILSRKNIVESTITKQGAV